MVWRVFGDLIRVDLVECWGKSLVGEMVGERMGREDVDVRVNIFKKF